MTIDPEKFVSTIFRNVVFIRIAGIIATLFFGFILTIFSKKLFTNNFNLIVNDKGIFDNSSYVSVGMIFWNDITSIKSINVMSTKFLIINVKDPHQYVNAQSGTKKKLLQQTFKTYGTPISISSNTLAYNFDELEEILHKYYDEYKK